MSHGDRALAALLLAAALAAPARSELTAADRKSLRDNFQLCVGKLKGPYTENFCLCADGKREPVSVDDRVRPSPCGSRKVQFCAAWRAPWADELAKRGLYLGNIFARDLNDWDGYAKKHDVVRGYILEKYFTETHPDHKLSKLRAYGGLAGAEYEAAAAPRLFERYLATPSWEGSRHYLLSYELQRRFFARKDLAQIDRVRGLATTIASRLPSFKPLRDAIHNQISPGQADQVRGFAAALPPKADRAPYEQLASEIEKLTQLSAADLVPLIDRVAEAGARAALRGRLPAADATSLQAVTALSGLMAACRDLASATTTAPADRRAAIDVAIAAGATLHARVSSDLLARPDLALGDALAVMASLDDAAYGAGLLSAREWRELGPELDGLRDARELPRRELLRRLRAADRVVEWAQNSVRAAFADVSDAWTAVLPDVAFVGDDIIRASPLLLYGELSRRITDHVADGLGLAHDVFGERPASAARVLNPGLATGVLRVQPAAGKYDRQDIVALRETPAELAPTAGILTQGEGNVVSHVQLLARNLGIPNVVLSAGLMKELAPHDGERVLLIATPLGRVILEPEATAGAAERAVVEEYRRNQKKSGTGALAGSAGRLHIDRARLDTEMRKPLDLRAVRRADSGRLCGPKAAYLGELAHMFPDHVSRGVVVPFGAYQEHYQRAQVDVPAGLTPGGRGQRIGLPDFVQATYRTFFDEMIPRHATEAELEAFIAPRLELIQKSLRTTPIAPELERDLAAALRAQGLLGADGAMTAGCFVRSDTNVEDLDTFTGAGLNLTIFNLPTYDAILDGIKEVWASPFSLRSFSWRQTVIDEPLWVLPSIVVLESVPSEKSGVAITADIDTGDPARLLVATSEGVGGAVDGSPAETLLLDGKTERLLAQFKAPTRRALDAKGGVSIVPSTGRDRVLEPAEIDALWRATRRIAAELQPVKGPGGKARPWDVEFGFVAGKLWLFQVRPFVGNDEIRNVPALKALERGMEGAQGTVSMTEVLH